MQNGSAISRWYDEYNRKEKRMTSLKDEPHRAGRDFDDEKERIDSANKARRAREVFPRKT